MVRLDNPHNLRIVYRYWSFCYALSLSIGWIHQAMLILHAQTSALTILAAPDQKLLTHALFIPLSA